MRSKINKKNLLTNFRVLYEREEGSVLKTGIFQRNKSISAQI